MLEKTIAIFIFTVISTIIPLIIKWYNKYKKIQYKKKLNELKHHPLFTFLNELRYRANNKLLSMNSPEQKRELLLCIMANAKSIMWEHHFKDMLENNGTYKGQPLLKEDIFSAWTYGFLKKMKDDLLYKYKIPIEFLDLYDKHFEADIASAIHNLVGHIIYSNIKTDYEKWEFILKQFQIYIDLGIKGMARFLEYANGEITKLLETWIPEKIEYI